jgi:4-hydroxybenzoate polyprenyltransferase
MAQAALLVRGHRLGGKFRRVNFNFSAPDSMSVPLCVDLDGTLLRTDVLVEGLLAIASNWRLLAEVPRLLTNRAGLNQRVAELAMLDPALLPYNENLLDFLRGRRAAGQSLVLATAADARAAHAIADHLGLFDEVICSEGVRILKGEAKAAALVERFGRGGFAYAGNDHCDVPIWREACSIVIVNAGPEICKKARSGGALVEAEFHDRPSLLRSALQAMRPHLWARNLLVFVPMIMAHAISDRSAWISALWMFAAFCATASGTYLLNDLTDLAADRRHPNKRLRPFATGALSIPTGIGLALTLIALGFGISAALGVLPLILIYVVASTGYSFALKELPLVDVFMLAGLSTLRLLGGGLATGHPAPLWLLAFSGFLFLSIALVKRTDEMMAIARASSDRVAARRGYRTGDLMMLQIFGYASAFASSVVLALFVGSTAASAQFRSPELLWGAVPLILFWQFRLWLSTISGHMHDDPIVYAARDWVSWIVAACILALFTAASYDFISFTSG